MRGVAAPRAGFPLARGRLGRSRDASLTALTNRVFAKGLPTLNAARAEHGLAPLTSFYDQVLTAHRILVLTSPTFDYAAPFVPDNARYVGPMLDEPGVGASRGRRRWPDDERPLVLVGLSSTFQDQAALLQRIIDALSGPARARRRHNGTGPGPALFSAPDNVARRAVGPARPDHRHGPAVVVTHCGHGTTLKSLAAGVPLVCIPMGRDQDDTAARVVHHGAGIRLRPSASVDAIRDATIQILERDEYRSAAPRLAKAIDTEHDPTAVVTEIESLTAHKPSGGS